jgi:hypothetical protein
MAYLKKIPFTIEINKKTFAGYLGTNDQSEPPKTFFAFVDDYVIGDLDCRERWYFTQKGSRLPRMTAGECNALAAQLGNIVVEWYE